LPNPIIEYVVDWDCIHLGSIELTVHGTPPVQYIWNTSMQADSTAVGLEDGSYSVTVSDFHGCSTSGSFTISGSSPLNFGLQSHYEVLAGDSVEIILTGDVGVNGLNFQWQPSDFINCDTCAQMWAFPDSNVVLAVQITNADSCVYELETSIVVIHDSTIVDHIYVPNVFSPNGDGINDRFSFFGRLPDIYIYELTLMDRWGELVFHTDNIPLDKFEGWDGTFRDKPMQPQVFVYFARVRLSDGSDIKLVGDVTLVR
jgi:gliding motility-associated-like protein